MDVAFSHANSPYITAYPFSGSFGTKYADPSVLPTANAKGCFSVRFNTPATVLFAVSYDSPYVHAYAWNDGVGFGTKYANPSSLVAASFFYSTIYGTRNNNAVIVSTSKTPFLHGYTWNDATGFGTKYADPSVLITGDIYDMQISRNDDVVFCAHYNSPYISAYPFNSTTGFGTKYANPSVLPPGYFARSVGVTQNTDAVAVISSSTPYLNAYAWNTATGFGTKYSNPSTLPAQEYNQGKMRFIANDSVLMFCGGDTGKVQAYKWNTATGFGSKYSVPGQASTVSIAYGFDVTKNEGAVIFGGSSGEIISAYNWSSVTGFGSKIANPVTLPTGAVNDVDISNIAIKIDTSISAKVNIKQYDVTQAVSAKTCIQREESTSVTAKTRILRTESASVSAKTRIFTGGVTKSVSAKVAVLAINIESVSAKLSVKKTIDASVSASMRLFFSPTKTVSAKVSVYKETKLERRSHFIGPKTGTIKLTPINSQTPPSLSVSSKSTSPTGLFIGNSGTSLYVICNASDAVHQYTLSTPWVVNSGSFTRSLSIYSQETTSNDIFFNPTGTKMYIIGQQANDITYYNLSVAWDISTAAHVSQFSVATQQTSLTGFYFKPDGTRFFTIGYSNDTVFEYSLSTPWDMSTASYASKFLSISAQETTPHGVSFSDDGTLMYVMGIGQRSIIRYVLSTPWDITTAVAEDFELLTSVKSSTTYGMFFGNNGNSLYIASASSDSIFQYNLLSPWVIRGIGEDEYIPANKQEMNSWLYTEDNYTLPRTDFCFSMYKPTGVGTVTVALYNVTDEEFVPGASLTVTASGHYTLENVKLESGKEYAARASIAATSAGICYIIRPRIVIAQEDNFIKKTQFYYPLASNGLIFQNETWTSIWPNREGSFIYTHDASKFDGNLTCYIESHFYATSGNTNYLRLYDMTSNLVVSGSEISTSSTTSSRIRSDGFSLEDGKEYVIQMRTENDLAIDACGDIRLVFVQSVQSGRIEKTIDFIDLREAYDVHTASSTAFTKIQNSFDTTYPYGTPLVADNYQAYTIAARPIGAFILDNLLANDADTFSFRHYDKTTSTTISTETASGALSKTSQKFIAGDAQYYISKTANQEILLQLATQRVGASTLMRAYNFGILAEIFYRTRENSISAKLRVATPPEGIESFSASVRTISCQLDVLWDGISWTDESQYLISAKGNSQYAGKNGELVSDECDFELDNIGERFSPDNESSTIYRYIRPNIKIRYAIGVNGYFTTIFTGYIKNIEPDIQSGSVNIHCFDNSTIVIDKTPPEEIYQDKYYHEVIQTLGESAGIDSTKILTEESTSLAESVYFDEDKSINDILSEIAIAERGRVFFDRSGNLTFWCKNHYIDQQPVTALTQRDWILSLKKGIAEDVVVNKITVTAKPRKPDGIQVIWSNEDAVAADPYDSPLVWIPAKYYQNAYIEIDDPAIDWQVPQPYVDYVANSLPDGTLTPSEPGGTGEDLTGNIIVESFVTYKQSAFIKITNTGNTDAYLTEFNVRANPLKVYKWIKKQYTNEESIEKYGTKDLTIDNNWIYSDEAAISITRYEVATNKDIKKSHSVSIIGNPLLTSGELVTIETRKGKYETFQISEIDWSVETNGGYTQDLSVIENVVETVDFNTVFGIGAGVIGGGIIGSSTTKRAFTTQISAKASIQSTKSERISAKVNIVS